jgi:hypothetical protein
MTNSPNRSGRYSKWSGRPAERMVAMIGAAASAATATAQQA